MPMLKVYVKENQKKMHCVGVVCNYSSQAIILRNPHDLIKFWKKKSVSTVSLYNVDQTCASDCKIANCDILDIAEENQQHWKETE